MTLSSVMGRRGQMACVTLLVPCLGQTLRERALTTLALTCRCHTGGDYSDWANTLLSASILEYLIFFFKAPTLL